MRYPLATPVFATAILLVCATLLLGGCQNRGQGPAAEPPATLLLAASDLPDYERHLDHAGLISDWSEEFYHRGMVTYRTACYSCHGDSQQPGTIPDSRQFWKEKFKNGSDPYSMYQTLSRGFGRMPPQIRLTPREKYEVIHFIREEFIKEQNPDEYFDVTDDWIAGLPQGDTLGPDPSPYHPWAEMDYGDFLMRTYELANTGDPPRGISGGPSPLPNEDFRDVNFAYKGIAIRLDPGEGGVAAGNAFVLFDHDLLRVTGFWTGDGFIDYEDILLNDRHNIFPRTVGRIQFENPVTPGWANPATGDFRDPRFEAVDGRRFGPLPRAWAHYKGLYRHGSRVVISYSVADAAVLETYDLEFAAPAESTAQNPIPPPTMARTLNISAASTTLRMRVAPDTVAVALVQRPQPQVGVSLGREGGFHLLTILPNTRANVKLLIAHTNQAGLDQSAARSEPPADLMQFTRGGPALYTELVTTPIIAGDESSRDGGRVGGASPAYVADVLTLPLDNPWKSRMRPTGIDFVDGGEAAIVSTIDGEVYRVDGISKGSGSMTWRRIATGLFQPLGIKYHDGDIYVGCRDQVVILRDLNGDGETDFYESFNSDHQVTEHFHEFAMGLQTDADGNFYYAKSARHARTPLVPQHGTLIRISPDGSRSDIIANGFRAANGVALNPDGSFIVTDQEGHWNPMNRINWVEEGGFYGNMYGYGAPDDSSDGAMIPPLVWIDQKYDRSPAELLWADSDRWGPLNGHLLSLSYGYGKIFVVLPQMFDDTKQAGIVELPVPQFPTGIMRGRFNPRDGQLYVLGMSAWATNQMIQVGGLYRVRYTGANLNLPVGMKASSDGVHLTFASSLDPEVASSESSFAVTTWELKRTRSYGSPRLDVRELGITSATLSADGKTVSLTIDGLKPTWVMEIKYALSARDGTRFTGVVQSTIHELEDS